jgi:hypothetical protein
VVRDNERRPTSKRRALSITKALTYPRACFGSGALIWTR